jgi:hypothetical protein
MRSAMAHSALYGADSELGISYHALVVSVRRVHHDVQHYVRQKNAVQMLSGTLILRSENYICLSTTHGSKKGNFLSMIVIDGI